MWGCLGAAALERVATFERLFKIDLTIVMLPKILFLYFETLVFSSASRLVWFHFSNICVQECALRS